MKRAIIGVVAVLVCLLPAHPHAAAKYTFTKIADTLPGSPFAGVGVPQINNAGDVLFSAHFTDDTYGIIVGDGEQFTTIVTDQPALLEGANLYGAMAFNDRRQVTFSTIAFVDQFGPPQAALWKWDKGKLRRLTDPADQYCCGILQASINAAGDVAFMSGLADGSTGIFLSTNNRKVITRARAAASAVRFGPPLVSDAGTIIFAQGNGASGFYTELVTIDAKGRRRLITDGAGPYDRVGLSSVNANEEITFDAHGRSDAFDAAPRLVHTTGATLTELVTPGNGFRDVAFGSVTTTGALAFSASPYGRPEFAYGIYTGSDPIADAVVVGGDVFDGGIPQTVWFSQGLNERGQIAFIALYYDHAAIYRADPIGVTMSAP